MFWRREFELLRLGLLGITLWVRFSTVRIHLQSYFYIPIDQLNAFAKGRKQRLNPIAIQNTVSFSRQKKQSTPQSAICFLAPPSPVVPTLQTEDRLSPPCRLFNMRCRLCACPSSDSHRRFS